MLFTIQKRGRVLHANKKHTSILIFIITISTLFITAGGLYLIGYRYNHDKHASIRVYRILERKDSYYRGDWVLYCPPNNSSMKLAIKRGYVSTGICPGGFSPAIQQIVAIDGDYVSLEGLVRVNGYKISQALVLNEDEHHETLPHFSSFILQQGEYFMIRDLPTNSFDSRYCGPVSFENILALVDIVWKKNDH